MTTLPEFAARKSPLRPLAAPLPLRLPRAEAGFHLTPVRRRLAPLRRQPATDPSLSQVLVKLPFVDLPSAELVRVVYGDPVSRMAEILRRLRSRLKNGAMLDSSPTLLVTSLAAGEGKTTVAANLAASLALDGRRVLLVDANEQHPSLHDLFNLPARPGFGDVLVSPACYESAIAETDLLDFHVLPAGAAVRLTHEQFLAFRSRASINFHHVIFDAGSLTSPAARALAGMVDGVLTVVRADAKNHDCMKKLSATLGQRDVEHLGTILNGVQEADGTNPQSLLSSFDSGRAA